MYTVSAGPHSVMKSKILANMDGKAVNEILAEAKVKRAAVGRTIVTGGERAVNLFLLRTGRIRYYHLTKSGQEVLIALLHPGNVFGLGTLLRQPTAYIGTAQPLRDCELFTWSHERLRKLASKYPQIAENALRIVLHHVNTCVSRHVGLVTKTAEERLADTLVHVGDETGRVNSKGVEIEATNAHLSALADISRFTTSRLLNKWKRTGVISKGRGRVTVHSPESLLRD